MMNGKIWVESAHGKGSTFQFIAQFAASHPAVMSDRINDWPQQEGLDLEACRKELTFGERKRLVESYVYSRFGLPKSSRNRFKLVGKLQDKERPELGVFNGTLAV